MLDYKILAYKNIVDRNGESFIDLLSKSYNKDKPITGTFLCVNKLYIGRPDLISLAVYNSDEYADIICKVNGISNPFELNEDDMIFIPSQDYIDHVCKFYNENSGFINEDDELNENDKLLNNYQKKEDERRAPNEQKVGDVNYVIDKSLGVIFY